MISSRLMPTREGVVDERVVAVEIDIDDRLGDVVGEQPQLLLARRQRLLGQLQVVDVVFGAIQPAHLARRIEVGRDPAVHPAALAVGAGPYPLVLDVLALERALDDRSQERIDVVRHDLVRGLAVDFRLRPADPVGEGLVDERVLERAIEVGDRAGNVVGEQPQLRFLRLQRLANANVVFDVVDHRERAAGLAAGLAIGEQRDAHPAQVAAGRPLAPIVADGRAGERPLDVSHHLVERVGRDEILQRLAQEIVDRDADVFAVGFVGEAQTERAIEVEDRQADAVGDDAQAMLALASLELHPLDVVDVGVGREHAADVAARAPIRVVVDADPEGVALDRGKLALEAHPLAVERGFQVGVIELVELAAVDFDDFAADDVGLRFARPVEKRAIDETVTLIDVDVADREAERVQLAMPHSLPLIVCDSAPGARAGLQLARAPPTPRLPVQTFADCLLRRQVQASE